jgi:hypothetical protein
MRDVASWKKDKQGMGVTKMDPHAATEPAAAFALSGSDCVTNKARNHRTTVSVVCATFKESTPGTADAANRSVLLKVKEGSILPARQKRLSECMKMTALASRYHWADGSANECQASSIGHRLGIAEVERR